MLSSQNDQRKLFHRCDIGQFLEGSGAKARFSEVMRRARESGPQHVTVHGREAAVVLSPEEYRRLIRDRRTGADLIAAMQACPWPDDLVFERGRTYPPIRDVEL